MKKVLLIVATLMVSAFFFGCAYRHYMGLHGPSIKAFPDVHAGVSDDRECVKCHDPAGDPEGPPTNHPHFTGCLKCHNDDVKRPPAPASLSAPDSEPQIIGERERLKNIDMRL